MRARTPEPATSFRGRFSDWPCFFDNFLREHQITDILMFGDCRPYHVSARGVAALGAVAKRAECVGESDRGRSEPGQTKEHRVGDTPRDDRIDVVGGCRGRGEAASRCLVEQLAEEERITAGHLVARADDGREVGRLRTKDILP